MQFLYDTHKGRQMLQINIQSQFDSKKEVLK